MHEIGSEFWDVPVSTDISAPFFPKETAFFLSGRSALDFIIEEIQMQRQFTSVLLPSYCCETMIAPFLAHGIEVFFYSVYLDTTGHLAQEFPQNLTYDATLVMDYFGYSSGKILPPYVGIVIRDATHSIFTETHSDADYVFGSLRKWAGFWTGGYAWSEDGAFQTPLLAETNRTYVELRRQAMLEKTDYLNGRRPDKHHLSVFAQAEELLEKDRRGTSEPRDVECSKRLDVEFIVARRRENAAMLLKELSGYSLFPELQNSDCPLFVPIRVPNGRRDALRKFLIEREIYCPVHWPISPMHKLTEQTRVIYEQELSLVCDQRYTMTDMKRIVNAIREFLELEKM